MREISTMRSSSCLTAEPYTTLYRCTFIICCLNIFNWFKSINDYIHCINLIFPTPTTATLHLATRIKQEKKFSSTADEVEENFHRHITLTTRTKEEHAI